MHEQVDAAEVGSKLDCEVLRADLMQAVDAAADSGQRHAAREVDAMGARLMRA